MIRHFRTKRSTWTVSSSIAAMTMFASAAPAAHAQDAGSDTSEIVVTATKREQKLKDIPVAIAVVSGKEISENQLFNVTDFARLEPSIQFRTAGVGDSKIVIRGIQSAGAATTALYLDETVITGENFQTGGGHTPDIGLHDIARIEVLKGPQGTLFGASSMSGTVRIVTNKPNLKDFGGSVTASYSDGADANGLFNGEAVLNLPIITDVLAIRAVGWANEGGGYIDEIKLDGRHENVNDSKVEGGRLTALWQPTDAFSLTVSGLYQSTYVGGAQRYLENLGAYQASEPTRQYWDESTALGSATATYNTGVGQIVATTSYMDRHIRRADDTTGFAASYGLPGNYNASVKDDRSIWSSEIRFASAFEGPFQIVAGAFHQEDESYYSTNIILVSDASGVPTCSLWTECRDQGKGNLVVSAREVLSTLKQTAFFGESTFAFADTLTLTTGLRYFFSNQRNIENTLQSFRYPTSTSVQTEPVNALDINSKQHNLSYNFALNWTATPQSTFYVRAASGFRRGGINDASFASNFGVTIPAGYGPDKLWNYEIGTKNSFFGGKLSIEAAAYRIDWDDQQVSGASADGTFGYIVNAGKSRVYGAEFTMRAQPTKNLDFSFGITFTDSRLTEDQPTFVGNENAVGKKGDRLPNVARWNWSGQAEYHAPVSDTLEGYARTLFNYVGRSYTAFNSTDPYISAIGKYFLADAQIGVRTDSWDVGLFVRNLTNKVARLDVSYDLDGYRVATVAPRTFGVRASKKF